MDQEGAARLRQGDVLLAPVDQREPELRLECLMAFVTDGCETCRTFAVRVKFSSSLIVQKYSN